MAEEIVTDDSKNEIDQLIEKLGKEKDLNLHMCRWLNINGSDEKEGSIVTNVKIKCLEDFIEENKNYKNKYGRLLEKGNQQKLNEVVLNYKTVDSILKNVRCGWPGSFDGTYFDKFKSEVTNLLKYTTSEQKKYLNFVLFNLFLLLNEKL